MRTFLPEKHSSTWLEESGKDLVYLFLHHLASVVFNRRSILLVSSWFGCLIIKENQKGIVSSRVWLSLSVRSQSRSQGVIVVIFLMIILNLFSAVVVQFWECYLSWHANNFLIFTLFLWSHSLLRTFLSSYRCTSSMFVFLLWSEISSEVSSE